MTIKTITDSDILDINGFKNKTLYDIIHSEGYKAEQEINRRYEFLFILEQNFQELKRNIEFCAEDPFLIKHKFDGKDENEIYQKRQQAIRVLLVNTNRLLFNFISSSYAILEFNKISNKTEMEQVYRIPLFGFFFGLRNHFLHGNIIDFAQTYAAKINDQGYMEEAENGFFFDLEKIKEYPNRWKGNAEIVGLQFIQSNLPKVDLIKICDNYCKDIATMHNDITQAFYDKNKTNIDKLNVIRKEYNLKI